MSSEIRVRLAVAFTMSLVMSISMTGIMGWLNAPHGITLHGWAIQWAVAWPIAFVLSLFYGPLAGFAAARAARRP